MRAWLPLSTLAALSACSLDWGIPAGIDADGGSMRGADASLDASLDTSSDAPGAADGGDPAHDALADADGGLPFECSPTKPCAGGLVCHYADHLCGQGAPGGRCIAPRTNCVSMPAVCGCDGKVYMDDCDANRASQDVSARGNCQAPGPSDYACGYVFCWYNGLPNEYCRRHTSGAETTYECPFAPTGCDGKSCAGCTMTGCGPCQTLDAGGWMFDCP